MTLLKTFYIETWGCQMNTYDSEKMSHLIQRSHGMVPVEDPEKADLLLLNTCSIREKAEEKVFSQLGRWKKMKDLHPHKRIGVGGCVASQEGDKIFQRAPYVDFVFGPQTLQDLPLYVNELHAGKRQFVHIDFRPEAKFDELPPPIAEGVCAFVTIQEGCSKYCKYCIVPFTRGPEVNRKVDDIFEEITQLSSQRVREITLLGQNVNAYQGLTESGEVCDLATLIFYIAQIPGIDRVRFMTSHPVEFTETLVEAYGHVPELASHLHLPVQTGSNRVLQNMGRGHTREEYLDKIQALKNARPDLSVTSDFIVGYPGETEEDFLETLRLVDEVQFDQSFCFIYSPRPGTLASGLACSLTVIEKKDRLSRLQNKLNYYTRKHHEAMLGRCYRVLITKISKDGKELEGRTEQNKIVHIHGGGAKYIGVFVDTVVTDILANSVRGRFLEINDPYLEERLSFSNPQEIYDSKNHEDSPADA
jgi:tRNA-2-methylthio-N6-dimethylallyladenosine synthase